MSAISDFYIHYRYEDYQGASGIVAEQDQITQALINQLPGGEAFEKVVTQLSKRLKDNMASIEQAEKQKILDAKSRSQITDLVSQALTKVDGGSIVPSGSSKQQSFVNIDDLKAKRAQVSNKIANINRSFRRNQTAQIKASTLDSLLSSYKDFENMIGAKESQILYDSNSSISEDQVRSMIGKMRDLLSKVTFSTAATQAIGAFGQNLVAACNDTARNKAADALSEAITEGIVGEERSGYTRDMSDFTRSTLNISQKDLSDRGVFWNISPTQNKVDAEITIDSIPLNVSVKGTTQISNTVNFHLQDMNILTALTATTGKFMNHWMNVHAALGSPGDEGADEALEKFIAYQALASGTIQKQVTPADVFCAIDEINGNIYIKTTKQILQDYNNIRFSPRLSSSQFNMQSQNIWVGGAKNDDSAKQRNLNVIAAFNDAHTSVSINALMI